jgi:hypothetical protein
VGVALFLPGVADVVVTACLPEAAPVLGQVLDAAQPLGALVAVEVRDDETQREAVFGGEELAVVVGGQEGLLVVRRGRAGRAVQVGDDRGVGEGGELLEGPRAFVAGGGGAEDA